MFAGSSSPLFETWLSLRGRVPAKPGHDSEVRQIRNGRIARSNLLMEFSFDFSTDRNELFARSKPVRNDPCAWVLLPRTLLDLQLDWAVEVNGDQAPGTGLYLALHSLALSAMGSYRTRRCLIGSNSH